MRKRNPNDVIASFRSDVHASLEDWSTVMASVRDQPVTLRSGVSRDAFFRLPVRWELFRSDWHIAAATRDPSRLRTTIATEVDRALAGRPELTECRPFVHVQLPAHPTLEQTRRLLDPAGRNISLPASSSGRNVWVQKSETHLAGPWGEQVRDLPLADHKVVELVDCLRNIIAHGSRSSLDAVNAALAASTAGEESVFGARPMASSAAVSRYLHTPVQGCARVEHFHKRLAEISDRMRVSGIGRGEVNDAIRRPL